MYCAGAAGAAVVLCFLAATQVKSSQSAKKAANLRAKFEKWESEVERNNELNQNVERYEEEDECMPSIDTARNLRAMFENKAQESSQPVNERPKVKVNRFVVSTWGCLFVYCHEKPVDDANLLLNSNAERLRDESH